MAQCKNISNSRAIAGCKRRIVYAQFHLDQYIKYRGTSEGTFWQDIDAVDKSIEEQKEKILELNRELDSLRGYIDESLLQQLKSSEIF